MHRLIYHDLGLFSYKPCWDMQEELFAETQQMAMDDEVAGHLIFVEHPHVFTLGKSGDQNNLLINEQLLKQRGAEFFHINRGGDITYHGPGQLVGYPILRMDKLGIGIRSYINKLEETIIRTLEQFSIVASRLEGAAGVWLDVDKPSHTRKICAIGVRASRQVTMHGFAFNINTDLSFYNLINPCGFTDKGVTSLQKELGREVDMDEVKSIYQQSFAEVFGVSLTN
jgi:lipoyl(octanoyl) transferase